MTKRVYCGEGKYCNKCILGMEMQRHGITPSFPIEENEDHCKWYEEKEERRFEET